MAKAEDNEVAETKANGGARARAKTRAVARTKASEAMAKTNGDVVAEATKNDSAGEDDVTVNIYNFQELSTEQLESNTTAASSFLDKLQAIATEANDYSRRSQENRPSFVGKLIGATTFESAVQIQTEPKTSYAGFIA